MGSERPFPLLGYHSPAKAEFKMNFLPKEYGAFNLVVFSMGIFFIGVGSYGLMILGFSGPVLVWVIRGIPLVFVVLGWMIVLGQLRIRRSKSLSSPNS
jgi:hypothetical protein